LRRHRALPLLILVLIFIGVLLWFPEGDRKPLKPPILPREKGVSREGIPPPPPVPSPPEEERGRLPLGPSPSAPRVAIIIDDLGYNDRDHHRFLAIHYPLTFAILPDLPYSQQISREGSQQGREVMLHLPLEPWEYPRKNPGRGVILSSMREEEMREVLSQDLRSVPDAVGVNNHMGSRLTEERRAMRVLLSEIKGLNLYFIDSLTTKDTVIPSLSREIGIRAGSRNVFLDNLEDRSYIEGQLQQLIHVARRRGEAIGVGHAYPLTAEVLRDFLPKLEAEGIRLVPASQTVHQRKAYVSHKTGAGDRNLLR
jgi:uncharacterized protein